MINHLVDIMTKKIKIDFVSDAVCPWCAIGYTRLKQAISELDLQDKVTIAWQPFFLNPDIAPEGENIYDYGTRKYGRTKQDGDLNRTNITKLGQEAGFTFNFTDKSRVVNTRDAHTLLDYVKGTDKQTKLKEGLFNTFFTEQKDISDRNVLAQLTQKVGLSVTNLSEVLDNPKTQHRISEKVSNWHTLGIPVVPTLIFNNDIVINGSRTVETYKQMLTEFVSQ